ncbi:unnamed protein product [Meloidogyne enterolobii]|uniref:Uncharacterized protein n=1 Tax=Meloidogyne enterolobii TaxID=390850 RepID=A0ACB1B0M9_MELEN
MCNEDTLLTITSTTTETKTNSWISSITTKESPSEKTSSPRIKNTTIRLTPKSSAQIHKHESNVMALALITIIVYYIL